MCATAGMQSPLGGHDSHANATTHVGSVRGVVPIAAGTQLELTLPPHLLPKGSPQVVLEAVIVWWRQQVVKEPHLVTPRCTLWMSIDYGSSAAGE